MRALMLVVAHASTFKLWQEHLPHLLHSSHPHQLRMHRVHKPQLRPHHLFLAKGTIAVDIEGQPHVSNYFLNCSEIPSRKCFAQSNHYLPVGQPLRAISTMLATVPKREPVVSVFKVRNFFIAINEQSKRRTGCKRS